MYKSYIGRRPFSLLFEFVLPLLFTLHKLLLLKLPLVFTLRTLKLLLLEFEFTLRDANLYSHALVKVEFGFI